MTGPFARLSGLMRRTAPAALVGQGVDVATQMLAVVVAARAVGPAGWGDVGFAFAVVGTTAVFVLFGTDDAAIRLHASGAAAPGAVLGAQLGIAARGFALASAAAAVTAVAAGIDTGAAPVLVAALTGLGANAVAAALFHGLLGRGHAAADLPGMIVSRAVLVALAWAGGVTAGAAGAAAAWPAAACGLVLMRIRAWRHAGLNPVPHDDPAARAAMARAGRSIGTATLFGLVAQRADVLLLKAVAAPDVVGLYVAAARPAAALSAIGTAAALALYPARLSGGASGRRRFAAAPVLLLAAAAIAAAAAEPLLGLLYGPAFAGAGPVLAGCAAAAGLQIVGAFVAKALIGAGLERALPPAKAAGAATTVAALVLVARGDGPASAWIVALGEAVTLIGLGVMWIVLRKFARTGIADRIGCGYSTAR